MTKTTVNLTEETIRKAREFRASYSHGSPTGWGATTIGDLIDALIETSNELNAYRRREPPTSVPHVPPENEVVQRIFAMREGQRFDEVGLPPSVLAETVLRLSDKLSHAQKQIDAAAKAERPYVEGWQRETGNYGVVPSHGTLVERLIIKLNTYIMAERRRPTAEDSSKPDIYRQYNGNDYAYVFTTLAASDVKAGQHVAVYRKTDESFLMPYIREHSEFHGKLPDGRKRFAKVDP